MIVLTAAGLLILAYPLTAGSAAAGLPDLRALGSATGALLLVLPLLALFWRSLRERFVPIAELLGAACTGYCLLLLAASNIGLVPFGLLLFAVAGVSFMSRHRLFLAAYALGTTVVTGLIASRATEGDPQALFGAFLVAVFSLMGFLFRGAGLPDAGTPNEQRIREAPGESEELARSLTLFKRGIEQTNDAVLITDAEGRITFANRAMEEITSFSLEEMKSRGGLPFFYEERKRWEEDRRRLSREGSLVMEHLIRDRHGRDHAVLIRGDSIVDAQGQILGTILIHADLDKMKRYEGQLIRAKQRAEEANRAKSVFLANMSHEIRTPINGMLGLLRLLPDADPETRKSYHRLIEEASSSLVQLIDDILDLSRIEADRLTLMPQAFDLSELLDHVGSFFAADVERKGIAMSVDIDEETPETIVTDRIRLQQVLTNLIGNAVKYTESGFVRVSVYPVEEGPDSAVKVGFSVEDSGIGISEENQAKLFGYFQQLEEGYAKRYGGAGVGLAVSKRLVELMGGEIAVRSTPGEGSTFTFTIDAIADRRSQPREEDKQMHLELRRGLKILLAEDNEINLLAMKAQLERSGHQVTVARDGHEALEQFGRESFDVALIDVQMPNLDGVEVVKRIRKAEGAAAGLPVFAVTAYAMDEQKVRFVEAGFDEVLIKPIAPDALQSHLARLWEAGGA